MTTQEFQQLWGGDYRIFLKSDLGKALFETLEHLRMDPRGEAAPHQMHYRLGGIAGYEECLANMLKLANPVVKPDAPKANYGVKPTTIKEEKKTS